MMTASGPTRRPPATRPARTRRACRTAATQPAAPCAASARIDVGLVARVESGDPMVRARVPRRGLCRCDESFRRGLRPRPAGESCTSRRAAQKGHGRPLAQESAAAKKGHGYVLSAVHLGRLLFLRGPKPPRGRLKNTGGDLVREGVPIVDDAG